MNNKFFGIMLILGLCSVVSGEVKEQDADLSLSAKAVLQEMDRTIQQAKQKALDKLKTAMKSEMQMGNLNRANRINQEIQKISEDTEKKPVGDPQGLTMGEWQTKTGITFVFDKKFEVRIPQNGYSGVWKVENKTVLVTLNWQDGKPAATTLKYTYELPIKKEVNKKTVYVMSSQAGYEDVTTLFKKE
jgi:hypothetical protein